ncbi:fructosamine kinase family protein [Georgenia sp. Z1491]|uniref:fructosamine kinase family protein n=1 Tax=Georgenia sp. Z1491 TaxID=3416707 RepID=UPI003CF36F98
MATHRKTDEPTTLAFETAGLRWLTDAESDGGAPVVGILAEGEGWVDLDRLEHAPATPDAAAAFGRALARTHAAGAPSLGCAPPGWSGEVPRSSGVMPLHGHDDAPVFSSWGEFYAEYQIRPYVPRALANGSIDEGGGRVLEQLADRLAAGQFDHAQPALVGDGDGTGDGAARLHGDLWGGNVVWTGGPRGSEGRGAAGAGPGRGCPERGGPGVRGVLIDPAAHGGHAETDLAALDLFGIAHLPEILAGYDEVSPLSDGWQERVGLHQLTMLVMHAVIFGGSYGPETVQVARRYL